MAQHVVGCEGQNDPRVLALYLRVSQLTGITVDGVRDRIHAMAAGGFNGYA